MTAGRCDICRQFRRHQHWQIFIWIEFCILCEKEKSTVWMLRQITLLMWCMFVFDACPAAVILKRPYQFVSQFFYLVSVGLAQLRLVHACCSVDYREVWYMQTIPPSSLIDLHLDWILHVMWEREVHCLNAAANYITHVIRVSFGCVPCGYVIQKRSY